MIDEGQRLEPAASPLFAPDEILFGLPPALVITCGDDSLGEEAERYAARLIHAGVPITACRFLNSHHFLLFCILNRLHLRAVIKCATIYKNEACFLWKERDYTDESILSEHQRR